MIDKIKLKSGSSIEQPKLEFDLTPITVFVGPNNSGKSRILIEIENYCRTIKSNSNQLLIDKIILSRNDKVEFENEIEKLKIEPTEKYNLQDGEILISKLNSQTNKSSVIQVKKENFIKEAENPNIKTEMFPKYPQYLSLFTIRLDGTNRLSLLKEQDAGDLQQSSENHLSHLFSDNELRKKLRRITFDAFDKYLVIDPTKIGKLRARLSEKEPENELQEKGWHEESVDFHKNAVLIGESSDGVKAFCGIMTTIMAGDPKITLIDEPEAFLHPSLSNKLGKEIGRSLINSNKRLIVATHSSAFLMGCIQSGAPINIVRLTYKNEISTSRLLPKEKILTLMRHPLLRSTGILNGLFYESVIVTEADSDRAFYQEINERLLSKNDSRGIQNCLFLNAQNKQTVWDIVKPLRELGIPAIGIVDIDVLKEGGKVFTKLLEGSFIPNLNHPSLHSLRKSLYDALNATEKNWKIEGGINLLDNEDQETCNNFLDQLDEYGVFVIRNGELESWLKELDASGHGSNWLIDVFSKMGDNPENQDYINPTESDVWNFIGELKEWIDNSNRKGIPE